MMKEDLDAAWVPDVAGAWVPEEEWDLAKARDWAWVRVADWVAEAVRAVTKAVPMVPTVIVYVPNVARVCRTSGV